MEVKGYINIPKKFFGAAIALAIVLVLGTIGYWIIGGGEYSLVDCFYMTFITVSTIGYGEVINLHDNPAGRLFTVFIATWGIGVATYIITNLTAFMVEVELSETFLRRKMNKEIKRFKHHFIVCGVEGVGFHVINELTDTKRPHVVVDKSREHIDKLMEIFPGEHYIVGDASDSDILVSCGIKEATGLFAITGDDNENLVICLSAKQLNPTIRVVARCQDLKNVEKMKRAGANAVVSPSFIGGMRMASEMVRATTVSFLDKMLRDKDSNLRVEEMTILDSWAGKTINNLNLKSIPEVLLLAVQTDGKWIYNPSFDYVMQNGDKLICMVTPDARMQLEQLIHI